MPGWPHACSYLPGREANTEFTFARRISPAAYEQFLNAGFRRSGQMIYRPACGVCRECQPIRAVVDEFQPDRSMRRCWQANLDLTARVVRPRLTPEKTELYRRYQTARHDKDDPSGPEDFLYVSPVESREIEFRLGDELVAVAIVDVVPAGLSAVYTYFSPEYPSRGLGTYAVLREIEYCRQHGKRLLYLGYYVRDCRKMNYKNRFVPHEILGPDGVWRRGEA
jgi:arginine-tRNA-protein transferase